MNEPLDLDRMLAVAEAADRHDDKRFELRRYDQGGGRFMYYGTGTNDRNLIADFYSENNREFFATCSPEKVARLIRMLKRRTEWAQALGAMPNGYCYCSKERDGGKSQHEPECAGLRAALAYQGEPDA